MPASPLRRPALVFVALLFAIALLGAQGAGAATRPTITSFAPSAGAAGTVVTINGTNFTGATAVKFNGIAAASFTVVSATKITATAPATGSSGTLSVTTGVGTGTSSASFLYPPGITSFTPTVGTAATAVTITGVNFTGATSVTFNGTTTTFTIKSATSITTKAPTGVTSGPIRVTTPAGTATSATSFTAAPRVTSFSPASGGVGGVVTITGANFTAATAVKFNLTTAGTYTVDSATQITAVVPTGATTGKISVTTSAGTGTSATSFTIVAAPTITALSPTTGAAGTTVTVTGTGLSGATAVRFGGTSATFTVVSATSISAKVPFSAVTGAVTVTTPGGTASSPQTFVSRAPTVTAISPASALGGSSVTIAGSNFSGTTSVSFGAYAASFTVDSSTQITAVVPTTGSAPTGLHPSVCNADGCAAATQSFDYAPAPAIASFTPASGRGGDTVTVAGTGLAGATNVLFVDSAQHVTSALSWSANGGGTQLTAILQGSNLGATHLRICNTDGCTDSADTFTFDPPPTIASFTPTSGQGGDTMTVTGSNLTRVTSVLFVDATSHVVSALSWTANADGTQLTAILQGSNLGATHLRICNTDGCTDSADTFTFDPPPTIASFTPTGGQGGDTITITGTGFTGANYVLFVNADGHVQTALSWNVNADGTQLTALLQGADLGATHIRVCNPDGCTDSADTFTFDPVPTVTSFTPTAGQGADTIVITGTGFGSNTSVGFAGETAGLSYALSRTVDSDTQITAVVPDTYISNAHIRVCNNNGCNLSSGLFTFAPPPTISSFTPASGTGGDVITITGSGFVAGQTSVAFVGETGGILLSEQPTVDSATQITATVPAGSVANAHVRVCVPDGCVTSTDTFTFT